LQVVLQDRDAARVPPPSEVLEHHRGGDLGVLIEHGRHGVLERIEERRQSRSPVLRWVVEPEQAGHGVAAHPQALGDLRLGQALAMQAVDIGPVVH